MDEKELMIETVKRLFYKDIEKYNVQNPLEYVLEELIKRDLIIKELSFLVSCIPIVKYSDIEAEDVDNINECVDQMSNILGMRISNQKVH